MKKVLVLLVVLVGVFTVVGCGGSKETSQVEENEEIVFNMGIFWLDSNIEPTEGWHGWTLARCGIGENLVQFDENMNIKNVLAKSYEVLDDQTTVFEIREDVKFHNGNIMDAEAVKKSIERSLEITNREDVIFPLEEITVDGNFLTIKTSEAYPTLINNLADPVFIIVDTSVADDENFKYKPIATGAFKLVEFNPDQGMKLEKHDQHWSGDVQVDIVNVMYIQDGSTRAMTLQSGEIDYATQISSNDLSLFENNEDYKVLKGPNLRVFLLRTNMDKAYMQNEDFRRALSYAIDKETYATNLVNGINANGPFNKHLPFGNEEEECIYGYDVDLANKILDEAGFLDESGDGIREFEGENIVLKYISRTNHGNDANTIGVAMQSQLEKLGIGLEVIQVEDYSDMDFDFKWERWTSAPTADPQNFLGSYISEGTGNAGNYSNESFDSLYEELNSEMDQEARYELGRKMSNMLVEDNASIFLYYQEGNVVTSKNIKGVTRYMSEVYYIDHNLRVEK